MTKTCLFTPGTVFTDNNGNVLSSGNVYVYINKQTTLATIYSDSTGTITSNPYVLTSQGLITALYVDPNSTYSIVITDSAGRVLATMDDFVPTTNSLYAAVKAGTLTFSQFATTTANKMVGSDGSGTLGLLSSGTNISISGNSLTYSGSAPTSSEVILYNAEYSGTTLNLSSYFSSSYDVYQLYITGFVSTGATLLGLRVKDSGGFKTSGYSHASYGFYMTTTASDTTTTKFSGSVSTSDSNSNTYFPFSYDTSVSGNGTKKSLINATTYGINNFISTIMVQSYPCMWVEGMYQYTSNLLPLTTEGMGRYTGGSITMTGFEIYSDSTWTGRVLLIGLKNS